MPQRPDTLYFDGLCPLCTKEIRTLKRLKDDQLDLVDIHQLSDSLERPSRRALLQTLHLQTSDGRWLRGVDATVAAWKHTAWGALFAPLCWPFFKPITKRVYAHWAKKRYEKRYGCGVCMGSEE